MTNSAAIQLYCQESFMEATNPPSSPLLSTPLPSSNVAALLKIKILSWSQETGFPVGVRVRLADTSFNLHKLPLIGKSGYFREKLKESNEVELPPDFPGGAQTLEMIALFIYGSSTLVDHFNVAALRCAAEFLHMTEEYGTGNLCERFDIYLNQVVLQSWNHTLIVLQKCRTLLPWAEDLLIVSRCIETLAFMACMEILDPERRRDHPVVTLEALSCSHWSDGMVKNITSQNLWIKDLMALPHAFFERVIGSLRRQGMKEKYVSPIILLYAHKWMVLKNIGSDDSMEALRDVLQGVIDLLPQANKVIPIGFYLSLLSSCIEFRLRNECVEKLQNQILSVLHLAQVQDFDLLPKGGDGDGIELSMVETLFSKYFMDTDSTPVGNSYAIAELWDAYLKKIASDSDLSCERFISLIETVPISSRQTHDRLYRACSVFFKSHPNISQEEKGLVCKYLNCQKLSQQVRIEAVQNELMPLRLIVQALLVQQLNTQQAFKECSDSFRYTNCGEFSASLSSSKSQYLGESPHTMNGSEGSSSRQPLGLFLRRPELSSRNEYESTSFRIQNLEKEVMHLKRSLQIEQISTEKEKNLKKVEAVSRGHGGLVERRMSKKKNCVQGQVSSCIGSVNLASQRKYATKIFKILQRLSLFGIRSGITSKRKQ